VREIRYALRRLAREPRFTVTALSTLALCLGANLTLFALVDAILLRPLPFPDSGRLVSLWNTYPRAGVERDGSSVTNYYERRGKIAAFSSLAIYRPGAAILGPTGATERVEVGRVSPEFFSTLGVAPVRGRAFAETETGRQTDRVAIVTDGYWRDRLGADPNVLGRELRVDGASRRVVGVLPADFRFLSSRARLYLPLSSDPEDRTPARRHSGSSTQMIARLAPGVSFAEAQAQIDAHNAAMEADGPDAKAMAEAGFRTLVASLHGDHVAAIRPILVMLQVGVLCLLLIGSVNLVSLLLIRAVGRGRESGIRLAIGGGRRHVMSETLIETTVLTLLGGLLGLGLGAGGIRLVAAFGADRLPLGGEIGFDGRTALVALGAALALSLAIGLPIAAYHLRWDSSRLLRSGSRGGTDERGTQGLRHAFIVAQIALAFVLLAGAGLLGGSLQKILRTSPGFRAEHVATGRVSLSSKSYRSGAERAAFIDRWTAEIGRRPGVAAAGVATNVPLSGRIFQAAITVEGHALRPGESPHGETFYALGGGAMPALGLPLRQGRLLDAADAHRAERVCVIDEDFARRYWPNGSALGHRLFQSSREEDPSEAYTIVGVVGAAKHEQLAETTARGAIYFPYGARFDSDLVLIVRTAPGAPELSADALRQSVRKVDSELAVDDFQSMADRISDSLVARRSSALLSGIFAAIALLITAIGTYGVASYAVAQRRREIGLRMALGARPAQVRDQFLGLGFRLLTLGTGLGLLGAGLAVRALRGLLFGMPGVPLATLAGTAVILSSITLLSCLLPSQAAARISPMAALAED
jgi:predicted permease